MKFETRSYRQTLLFLGAVIVPALVLAVVGMRAIRQEQELTEKRAAEQDYRAVELIRRELFTRVESLKLRAPNRPAAVEDELIALVARIEGGKLVLPWERQRATEARETFSAAFRTGEESLYQRGDATGAANRFREADRQAVHAAEHARAELLLAASLQRQGNAAGARAVNRALLSMGTAATDEYGIPFSLYAAWRLLDSSRAEDRQEITRRLTQILNDPELSPAAAHMASDLSGRLTGVESLAHLAARRTADLEQAVQLAPEIATLAQNGSGAAWPLLGKPPWLIGITGDPRTEHRVVVVLRAQTVLDSMKLPPRFQWALAGEPGSESLGETFPGLRLAIAAPPQRAAGGATQWFMLVTLAVVISIAGFSAYLLNRDVRREARLAGLRSQFVSSVSHELKTPISAIRACAELMQMGRVEGERATSEYLNTIVGESERLGRLVQGVLDFSRAEQGKRTYQFGPVALDEVVRSAAQALEYPLAQGGFHLRLRIEAAPPPIRGDRAALEQAITNVLANALKYSADEKEIDLSMEREAGRAVIRIKDYGVGIPPEEQQRVFEPFYRVPARNGHEAPGAGLGLALVKDVVNAHGGAVTVESEPGHGSTFSILLPLSEETCAAS